MWLSHFVQFSSKHHFDRLRSLYRVQASDEQLSSLNVVPTVHENQILKIACLGGFNCFFFNPMMKIILLGVDLEHALAQILQVWLCMNLISPIRKVNLKKSSMPKNVASGSFDKSYMFEIELFQLDF